MSEMNTFVLALKAAAAMPEVRIDREKFLMEELTFCCPREQAKEAVRTTPAMAGVPRRKIDRVAKGAVGYESNKVSTLTYSAGLHAGMSMLGMVPADVTRYVAHTLRIAQKLACLYGWGELLPEQEEMDEDSAALLTLFFGVMLDVDGAAEALRTLSETQGSKATRALMAQGIREHGLQFTVRQMTASLSAQLPKEVYGRRITRFIPIVGGSDLGGLTYITYKPMADRLRRFLASLKWCDPEAVGGQRDG